MNNKNINDLKLKKMLKKYGDYGVENLFTIPTVSDIHYRFGEEEPSFCCKEEAPLTDFASIQGCKGYYPSNEWAGEKTRNGYYTINNGNIYTEEFIGINPDGNLEKYYKQDLKYGVRVVSQFSCINQQNYSLSSNNNLLTYGEYSQFGPSICLATILELFYLNSLLPETGRVFTELSFQNDVNYQLKHNHVRVIKHVEYQFLGKKYIRAIGHFYGANITLTNDITVKRPDNLLWLEVTPIEWIISEKKDKIMSKNILVAGIPYFKNIKINNVKETFYSLNYFLNNIFAKEILQEPNNMHQIIEVDDRILNKMDKQLTELCNKHPYLINKEEVVRMMREILLERNHNGIQRVKKRR